MNPHIAEHIRLTTPPRGSFKAKHRARKVWAWIDYWGTAAIVIVIFIALCVAALL